MAIVGGEVERVMQGEIGRGQTTQYLAGYCREFTFYFESYVESLEGENGKLTVYDESC